MAAGEDLAPEGLSAGDWSSIREAYEAGRHAAYPVAGAYRARNPGQGWTTCFDGRGFTVTPDAGGWTWGLELVSYGFPGSERDIEGAARVRTDGARVRYAWDETLEEWYVNDRRGLEHGYTLRERPEWAADTEGPLTVTLAVRGGLQAEATDDARGARFAAEDGSTRLTYTGLTVLDASGACLPARVERYDGGLRLLVDERDARYPLTIDPIAQQAYLKASNTGIGDRFGFSVSISGNTVVVGADSEPSNATGVNGDQGNDDAGSSGAAYVFVRSGTSWSQQAYLKASNTELNDSFGFSVSISGDTIVVGAPKEASVATGVNGDQSDNSSPEAGAAYVFVRSGTTWTQQAYLKASNTEGAPGLRTALGGSGDAFGHSVSVSGDTIVVGAYGEKSNATGVNGDGFNNLATFSGAAYVFARTGTSWAQQAYLKASNTGVNDQFGISVSASGDTVVVGAWSESSNATGVNGDQGNNSAGGSGAAYVFVRSGTSWSQQAYLKASNTGAGDSFGWSVSVSGDTAVVGAFLEASNATGVNGDQGNDSASQSGAAYIFVRNGAMWTQQAYLKASNTGAGDWFGYSVSVYRDTVAIGASSEDSNATGIDGNQSNDSASSAGAAYLFGRSGTSWSPQAYVKASNTGAIDGFGGAVSVWGDTVVVGAPGEASNATGVNGDQGNNDSGGSGAAYVVTLTTTWTGATDSDWADTTNWTDGVPDTTRSAVIPDATTTPNDPVISVAGQNCSTLWVQASGTLDVSAGMDSLSVVAAAAIEGPITGSGQLVFSGEAVLSGTSTIGLTFSPAVRADAHLDFQGGPLSITGDLLGNASVGVDVLATVGVGGSLTVADDLIIDGSLDVGDGIDVGDTLASSSSGDLVVMGTGTCVVAGQLCFHGDITTSCSLGVQNFTPDPTVFEAAGGWPASVSIDVVGTVTLLTADLQIAGDLTLVEGTFAVGVDGTIDVAGTGGIVIEDGATLDITGFQTLVPAPAPITVRSGGKLNIGSGGELLLESNELTIESGGTLCLDGVQQSQAALSGFGTSRYTLALDPGAILAAKGFVFRQMSASGIVIGPGVLIDPAPFDLRGGVFDLPADNGVLLDVQRSVATSFRYLVFDDTAGALNPRSIRSTAGSTLTFVNWSGDLAPDATTAETYDDDPAEPSDRIVFGPPEESDVQDFTARWSSDHVKARWQTLDEVDSAGFLLQRSPDPVGMYVDLYSPAPAGPSAYGHDDFTVQAQAGYRYRLYELLTHGARRLIGEVVLPASSAPDVLLPVWGGTASPPPPPAIVVGPSGPYSDVPSAIRALAASRGGESVVLRLEGVQHATFELGPELAFDLCLVAEPGAVIDAQHGPLRIRDLPPERALELVGLVIDAGKAAHPALELEDVSAVVWLQDVELRSDSLAPVLRLAGSPAVIVQGGTLGGALALEKHSRASVSGTTLEAIELTGRSTLETRGLDVPSKVEPGSTHLARGPAPALALEDRTLTLSAPLTGLAWLGAAPRLAFRPLAGLGIEGLSLLDARNLVTLPPQPLRDGHARWSLGALPPGTLLYLQGAVLERPSRRLCLTEVRRLDER